MRSVYTNPGILKEIEFTCREIYNDEETKKEFSKYYEKNNITSEQEYIHFVLANVKEFTNNIDEAVVLKRWYHFTRHSTEDKRGYMRELLPWENNSLGYMIPGIPKAFVSAIIITEGIGSIVVHELDHVLQAYIKGHFAVSSTGDDGPYYNYMARKVGSSFEGQVSDYSSIPKYNDLVVSEKTLRKAYRMISSGLKNIFSFSFKNEENCEEYYLKIEEILSRSREILKTFSELQGRDGVNLTKEYLELLESQKLEKDGVNLLGASEAYSQMKPYIKNESSFIALLNSLQG